MTADPKKEPPRPALAKPSAAETAKAALRRLALSKLEPTPETSPRAWSGGGGPLAAAPAASTPAPAAAPAPASAKARPLFDRIAARLFDDTAQREELSQA